jgi:hypothetical protein
MSNGAGSLRQAAARALAVLGAAWVLAWPALVTSYPFMIPDSIVYALNGRAALAMLLHASAPRIQMRSPFYCIAIFWLHRNVTPWPVIALNAVLLSWLIWLVVRSIVPRRQMTWFLALAVVLGAGSTLSWHVSSFMPDVLGGALYLCIYLLVFAREGLRRWETVAVFVLAWWTAGAHLTHPVLAATLCLFLGLLWLLRYPAMRGRGMALLQTAAVILLAVAALLLANARMFGRPSLSGPQPPYLMARIVADGPSHWYLGTYCPQLRWTICKWSDRLPFDSDNFLWATDGIYQTATAEERDNLVREQWPLIEGVLRTTPRSQVLRSWHNFWWELTNFAIDPRLIEMPWVPAHLDEVFPAARAHYLVSHPRMGRLNLAFFHTLQQWLTWTGAVLALALLPWMWLCGRLRLLGLLAVVFYVIVANAMLTGVLSSASTRYQGRIAWLLPMLGGLAVAAWLLRARTQPGAASNAGPASAA